MNLVDYDHDGDLDLYATRRLGAPRLWRNNGNSTFTDISSATVPAVPFADAQMSIVTDFDNDRAVDMIVTHSQQSPSLLRNPREGRFQVTPLLGAGRLNQPPGVSWPSTSTRTAGWTWLLRMPGLRD